MTENRAIPPEEALFGDQPAEFLNLVLVLHPGSQVEVTGKRREELHREVILEMLEAEVRSASEVIQPTFHIVAVEYCAEVCC